MSDPRPSNDQGTGAALLHAAARRRAAAAADLALPEGLRLSEWQRATIRFLLEGLVRAIEDELRAGLAPHFAQDEAIHAALSSAHVPVAQPILDRFSALNDPDLVAALARRAEEHRIHRASNGQGAVLADLVRDRDAAIAAGAMAVLVATSRRFDRFQEPVMARTELGAELQHRLVWSVAAALRFYLVDGHGVAAEQADEAVAACAAAILGGYDEGDSLEARAMRLALGLNAAERLDDDFLARIAEDGNLPLLIAGIAVRARLDYLAAWEIVSAPDARGAPLLLKAAGIARQPAARILLRLNDVASDDDSALLHRIDLLDVTGDEAARQSIRLWSLDAGYRAAILRIGAQA